MTKSIHATAKIKIADEKIHFNIQLIDAEMYQLASWAERSHQIELPFRLAGRIHNTHIENTIYHYQTWKTKLH